VCLSDNSQLIINGKILMNGSHSLPLTGYRRFSEGEMTRRASEFYREMARRPIVRSFYSLLTRSKILWTGVAGRFEGVS